LGITKENFPKELPEYVEGLHFHTLCEQNADALCETLEAVKKQFGKYFSKIKWLNLGGGHHITREDYDIEKLIEMIRELKKNYNLEVYLEPGEAVALNGGYLVSEVVDIVNNGIGIDCFGHFSCLFIFSFIFVYLSLLLYFNIFIIVNHLHLYYNFNMFNSILVNMPEF
jgi:hypothetical protein